MKCGLDALKQQKIQSLTKQNQQLEQQIAELLQVYEEETEKYKHSNVEHQNYLMQIQVQEMRNNLLIINVNSLKQKIQQMEIQQGQTDQRLDQVQKLNKQLNIKLYEKQKQKQQNDHMHQRLKAQLKMYQTSNANGNNTIRICDNLKKKHECLLRTFKIYQNKLASHKKYLSILQKKQQKQERQRQQQKQKQNNCTLVRAKSSNAYKTTLPLRNNCEVQKKVEMDRKKMKQFDQLNRKKNQLLHNKK